MEISSRSSLSANSPRIRLYWVHIPHPWIQGFHLNLPIQNFKTVEGLHREFLRAGADVMQAFTFYASDDKLDNRGNMAGKTFTGSAINKRASELAKKVADEGGALTLGGICQCPTYLSGASKESVQEEFRKQIKVFVEAGLDFLLCEVKGQRPWRTKSRPRIPSLFC